MARKKSKEAKPDKRRRKVPKQKGMTKTQVREINVELKSKLQKSAQVYVDSIKNKCKSEIHISTNEKRQTLLSEMCNVDNLNILTKKYCELYSENFKGKFSDRYALFQMKWMTWIGSLLTIQTDSSVFPKNCNATLKDKSAVLHSIASAFSSECTKIIKQHKPSFVSQPVVKESVNHDNKDAVIAFSGACLRIIYKKAKKRNNQELIKLIDFLKMPKKQRDQFNEWGMMPPELQGLWTIPVSPLYSYVVLINKVLRENLTEDNFSSFGKSLIEVRKRMCPGVIIV